MRRTLTERQTAQIFFIKLLRRCPLSTLARRLGDETGDDLIADYLLPRWAVKKTVPFCTLVFVSGVVLVMVTYLLRQ